MAGITGALAMINGAQYMADPYYMPCALVICDGKSKGPGSNPNVRGMLVAEPVRPGLPKADLLDFEYDRHAAGSYSQGVQHWPILLDRNGKVKVKDTPLRAARSIVAKDFSGNLLFMTTEAKYFTLYNLGMFLKYSRARSDHGLNVHTAMNLDGGTEASMIIRSEKISYLHYGSGSTDKSAGNLGFLNWKVKLPGAIGVFPRNT